MVGLLVVVRCDDDKICIVCMNLAYDLLVLLIGVYHYILLVSSAGVLVSSAGVRFWVE